MVDNEHIKQQMIQIIQSQVKESELQHLVVSFIKEKDNFHFAHLAILHYVAFEGKNAEIVRLAAAIQLLILSFDMLDDLEDLDNMEEPWMKINHSIALNAATLIYTLSHKVILSLSSPYKIQILDSFTRFSLQAMEGQHLDLENSLFTEDECIKMMKYKSGSLIALASVSGMLLAGANEEKVETYSYQIGIAAQIENDFRDLFNPNKNDISAQKKSLGFLYLQKKCNEYSLDIIEGFKSEKTVEAYFGSYTKFSNKLLNSGTVHYLNVMKQIAVNKATKLINELPIKQDQIERLKAVLLTSKEQF
ncbi:polyprenyl synthetase family protein [Bacillus sp. AFS040349]|uniref:polyprenyl synthetase family protein n=1 Tax=Bacillus sp. AFS040349 TaxID=2033502 RepID=UPI000BFC7CE4|nr:polyprenyl synthetase family protein [Bacillus sp. AFS040349]PGT89275.1 isoprenyl transferase [Bacillus sp. AFS040349]